ncbi:hypothetical protein J1N35_001760 [Gossypium stocksii]|uniref:Uncharacterized protein n=1 Tax=Gossypium stocksii TaxID=47602 RepID=A0A9D4ALM3_9ROSI|nr:hypothetical protein J1N35_001760 [Gossypium stocksii]
MKKVVQLKAKNKKDSFSRKHRYVYSRSWTIISTQGEYSEDRTQGRFDLRDVSQHPMVVLRHESSKMTFTPLLNILTENKLNRSDYKEWKRNLMVVLSSEKIKIALHNKYPLAIQVHARKCREDSNKIVLCYMLVSMTSTLYKQLDSCKTAKAILNKLEHMFGGQAILA